MTAAAAAAALLAVGMVAAPCALNHSPKQFFSPKHSYATCSQLLPPALVLIKYSAAPWGTQLSLLVEFALTAAAVLAVVMVAASCALNHSPKQFFSPKHSYAACSQLLPPALVLIKYSAAPMAAPWGTQLSLLVEFALIFDSGLFS